MPTLHWIGKDKVVKHHHEVPFKTLRREYVHNAPEGTPGNSTGNRIIHGDNLEALKALLPEFEGRVKCIYIDPPYNTGNEGWVYNDNVNDPRIQKWLHQVVGKEGEDLSRHDKWLCMMYPRLKLLHRLLAEDGVLLVSIDENEHLYLGLMLEEIFGPINKIETFIWKKSYGGGAKSKHIVNLHEYIVCYAKNKDKVGPLDLPPDEKALKYYKYKDDKHKERGPYRLQPLATNSMDERPNLRYPILFEGEEIWPEKQWQWSRERAETAQINDELLFTKKNGKWTVSYKQYLKSTEGEERRAKAYSIIDGIYTQHGTNEIKAMFGDGKAFSFPKPSELITYLLQLVTDKDTLVLDSFGGSGTTAHAVLKLNAQDDGNRRFILVEMMEYAETITAERVRRVMNGNAENAGLGGSFEYYTIGEALFDEDGNLNEAVPVEEIRRYVAYTEGVEYGPSEMSPYYIGQANEATYLFHYEPNRATALDYGFLNSLNITDNARPTTLVVYADNCLLSQDQLRKHGIIFKKIPRDITRF
jgi:adenine-specific DNA-methyltransferase